MNSKIIKKLSINFEKEIVVDNIIFDRDVIMMHEKRLNELYKDLPEKEKIEKVNTILKDIILKDNFFNRIMEFIVPYYEFEIDDEELNEQFKILKEGFKDRDDKILKQIAQRTIEKELVFQDLEKQNNLKLTDKQLDDYISSQSTQLGDSLENIKKDQAKYNGLKNLIQEENITTWLLMRFPLRVNLPYDWASRQIMLFRPQPPIKK